MYSPYSPPRWGNAPQWPGRASAQSPDRLIAAHRTGRAGEEVEYTPRLIEALESGDMARDVFLTTPAWTAAINYDETTFGRAAAPSPWTISIRGVDGADAGRLVGFEGDGESIIAMHHLKPDPSAVRAVEVTVFRVNDALREAGADARVLAAFERWLLKRGWRGNIIKRMKFTDAAQVPVIRTFWIAQGFTHALEEAGRWDEHVFKRWR